MLSSACCSFNFTSHWMFWHQHDYWQPQEKIRAAFNWVSSACRNCRVTSNFAIQHCFLFKPPFLNYPKNLPSPKSSKSSNNHPTSNFPEFSVLPRLDLQHATFLCYQSNLRSLRGKACENHSVLHQIPKSHQVDQQQNQWLRRTSWSLNNTTLVTWKTKGRKSRGPKKNAIGIQLMISFWYIQVIKSVIFHESTFTRLGFCVAAQCRH